MRLWLGGISVSQDTGLLEFRFQNVLNPSTPLGAGSAQCLNVLNDLNGSSSSERLNGLDVLNS